MGVCVFCTHKRVQEQYLWLVCFNMSLHGNIIDLFAEFLLYFRGDNQYQNIIIDFGIISRLDRKSQQCVSCLVLSANPMDYIEDVLYETKTPSCLFAGGLCFVDDPPQRMMIGSNRIFRTLQTQMSQQDCLNDCEPHSVSVVQIPSSIVEGICLIPNQYANIVVLLCNSTQPIWRSYVSLLKIYCSSFLGKANISGEISFSCKVGEVASPFSLNLLGSFACYLCILVVNEVATPEKIRTNRQKTLHKPMNGLVQFVLSVSSDSLQHRWCGWKPSTRSDNVTTITSPVCDECAHIQF